MSTSTHQNAVFASPISSEEVDSHQGTPATKISPFSPNESRGQLKPVGLGFSRSKLPPQFLLFNANGEYPNLELNQPQDPFVSSQDLTGTTKAFSETSRLSPNASAFTPATLVNSGSDDPTARLPKRLGSIPAAQDGVHGMCLMTPL